MRGRRAPAGGARPVRTRRRLSPGRARGAGQGAPPLPPRVTLAGSWVATGSVFVRLPAWVLADCAERTATDPFACWPGAGVGRFPPCPVLEQFGWNEFSFLLAAGAVGRRGFLWGKNDLKTFASFSSLVTTSELRAALHLPVPQFPHVCKGRVEEGKAGFCRAGLGCGFSCAGASLGVRLPRGQERFWVRPKGG